MTRIARLFFIIAFMSAAGSCSIELAEKEADTKAMGRQLTDLVRVAATNNGRPQYGNRSGFYGLQNRGIEASSI
jgi:hypothetical protein